MFRYFVIRQPVPTKRLYIQLVAKQGNMKNILRRYIEKEYPFSAIMALDVDMEKRFVVSAYVALA